MKVLLVFLYRLHWLHFPAILLVTLLQRTPVLRLAGITDQVVLRSPIGVVLRSGATLAMLGAVHTLAGATTVISNARSNPLPATVGTPISAVVFAAQGGGVGQPQSWRVIGAIPPGLRFGGLTAPGTIADSTSAPPQLVGTPTTVGSYTMQIQAWEFINLRGMATDVLSFTVAVSAPVDAAPRFSSQPGSQGANVGASVTLTASATGSPAPTLEWRRNNVPIAGATGEVLTLNPVQSSDAGDYTVVASNRVGSATSDTATLTVAGAAGVPTFLMQPAPQAIPTGGTVVFAASAASAAGAPAPSLQWRREGSAISGATTPMLVLSGATAMTGNYSVVATNAAGSTPSSAAALTVSSAANFGRLINLSILTSLDNADSNFIMGFVVGGAGTSGSKPLLVRVAGPSLAQLGVLGANQDPKLELFSGSAPDGQNDNWGGIDALSSAFAQVGAFPYLAASSRDAAMLTSITTRDGSVKVSGAAGVTGTVIAELYDASSAAAAPATVPRLINVSVLKPIAAGATLTAGFVINGATSRTVLVRAIGPGLAGFGVGGPNPDPQLKLFDAGATKVAENDNWGGDPQLSAVAAGVGAFALNDPSSKDAVLLLTLPPGNYTAQVSGLGTATGATLVEVYEVP